jgi:hypothetical protein
MRNHPRRTGTKVCDGRVRHKNNWATRRPSRASRSSPTRAASTGRFADVTGGSFTMVATTEPFVLQPDAQGYTVPFAYTWEGEGWLAFGRGK